MNVRVMHEMSGNQNSPLSINFHLFHVSLQHPEFIPFLRLGEGVQRLELIQYGCPLVFGKEQNTRTGSGGEIEFLPKEKPFSERCGDQNPAFGIDFRNPIISPLRNFCHFFPPFLSVGILTQSGGEVKHGLRNKTQTTANQ